MDAFGIFEGGGVKGLAHIGAFAASQQRGVRFVGVAGTSAGAIVAALVAVGYKSSELYDPQGSNNKGLLDRSYFDFIDKGSWDELGATIKHAYDSFTEGVLTNPRKRKVLKLSGKALCFYLRRHKILNKLSSQRGVLNATKFTDWLEPLLVEKVRDQRPDLYSELSQPGSKVLFRHVDMPLKIIATDLTNQSFKVFSKDEDPDQSVAEAVAASISIPFLFIPVACGEAPNITELVDGGLVSNFPAWVFDRERKESPSIQTFGFKFVAAPDPNAGRDRGILRFVQNLALTALSGNDHLQSRGISNLNIIPLRVTTNTLQFDLAANDRYELYEKGRNCTRDAFAELFGWVAPDDPSIKALLSALHINLCDGLKQPARLRLSVLLPYGTYKDHLKVQYTFNFLAEDTDDQLELPIDAGVCGRCWTTRKPVAADMQKVKETFHSQWNMTKYQQALVRKELKSCLCLPIFKEQPNSDDVKNGNVLVGVFSIDTDADFVSDFQANESKNNIVDKALDGAQLIERLIRY